MKEVIFSKTACLFLATLLKKWTFSYVFFLKTGLDLSFWSAYVGWIKMKTYAVAQKIFPVHRPIWTVELAIWTVE